MGGLLLLHLLLLLFIPSFPHDPIVLHHHYALLTDMPTLPVTYDYWGQLPPWRLRLLFLRSISPPDALGSQTVQQADPERLRRPLRGNGGSEHRDVGEVAWLVVLLGRQVEVLLTDQLACTTCLGQGEGTRGVATLGRGGCWGSTRWGVGRGPPLIDLLHLVGDLRDQVIVVRDLHAR